jgi:hypothetical protein
MMAHLPSMPAMTASSTRRRAGTAVRLVELGMHAPMIAGARLARMAAEGCTPSARGRREMSGMVLEKQVAFAQAFSAMWIEAWRMQTQLALSWMSAAPSVARTARLAQAGMERIAAQGLAPVHRTVMANARRLR